jgi:hypothetical protein
VCCQYFATVGDVAWLSLKHSDGQQSHLILKLLLSPQLSYPRSSWNKTSVNESERIIIFRKKVGQRLFFFFFFCLFPQHRQFACFYLSYFCFMYDHAFLRVLRLQGCWRMYTVRWWLRRQSVPSLSIQFQFHAQAVTISNRFSSLPQSEFTFTLDK